MVGLLSSLSGVQLPCLAPGLARPVLSQVGLFPPALLFILSVVAAVGLILLLPGRREASLRKIGAIVMLAAAGVFAVRLTSMAAGMGAYFWIFSTIAVLGAVRVVTHSKPVYSALYFVLTVMASAGLFVLMWAEFMAAALVLIYAGAILVTYVFVIMLAAEAGPQGASGAPMHEQLAEHDAISREPIAASAVGFALLGVLLFVIFDRSTKLSGEGASGARAITASAVIEPAATPPASTFVPVGGTQKLGAFLFERQLVNLELAGLILTVAMVGAIVIARKRVVMTDQIAAETVVGPATPIDDNPHSIPVYGTENPRQKEYPET
jgi:NADH-quinone oxidoreductase subunit J